MESLDPSSAKIKKRLSYSKNLAVYKMVSGAVTFEFKFHGRIWDKFSEIILGKREWEERCLLGTVAKLRL